MNYFSETLIVSINPSFTLWFLTVKIVNVPLICVIKSMWTIEDNWTLYTVSLLAALVKFFDEFSAMCFTETWLQEDTPDPIATIGGFQTSQVDRNKSESGKKRGGGVAAFIKNRWCHTGHITVKEHCCSPDVELLVTVRAERTLDLLYADEACKRNGPPPTGKIRPQPGPSSARLQTTGLVLHAPINTLRRWSEETYCYMHTLQDCFQCMDWDVVLMPYNEDLDGLTDWLTEYINCNIKYIMVRWRSQGHRPPKMLCQWEKEVSGEMEQRLLWINWCA